MSRTFAQIHHELSTNFREPDGIVNSRLMLEVLKAGSKVTLDGSKVAAPTNAEVLATYTATAETVFLAGLSDSVATAGIAATAETVFELKVDGGTAFATITFAIAGTVGVFALAADEVVPTSGVVTLVAQATADGTLAELVLIVVGYG